MIYHNFSEQIQKSFESIIVGIEVLHILNCLIIQTNGKLLRRIQHHLEYDIIFLILVLREANFLFTIL